jgi:phage anti-repressor protein
MSMPDVVAYVKRLTSVPERFIDELFEFYFTTTTQRDLVIPLDRITVWLGTKKQELVRTLKRSYVLGVDFVIEKAPNPTRKSGTRGANNYKRVLLTPDCFKRLCMQSRTPKAELVRSYFIDVETQFLRYKDEMMDGLRRAVERLERDMKPKRLPGPSAGGYMYVLNASEDVADLFKTGRAGDLKNRMFAYQTGRAHEVEPVYIYAVHDMRSAERCVKAHLAEFQYRKRREVYQVPLDLLKDIIVKCDAIDGAKREYTRRRATVRNMTGGADYFVAFNKNLILPGRLQQ